MVHELMRLHGISCDTTSAGTCRNLGDQRRSTRQAMEIAARVVWKDARGTTRFNSVVIRDISETGAYVEHISGAPIPLYRLVSLQAERAQPADGLPARLRQGKITSAVFRVGSPSASTGTPEGYGLRLLVEPRRRGALAMQPRTDIELTVAEASA